MSGRVLTGGDVRVCVCDCEGGACDVRVVGAVHSALFIQVSRASDGQDRQVGAVGLMVW